MAQHAYRGQSGLPERSLTGPRLAAEDPLKSFDRLADVGNQGARIEFADGRSSPPVGAKPIVAYGGAIQVVLKDDRAMVTASSANRVPQALGTSIAAAAIVERGGRPESGHAIIVRFRGSSGRACGVSSRAGLPSRGSRRVRLTSSKCTLGVPQGRSLPARTHASFCSSMKREELGAVNGPQLRCGGATPYEGRIGWAGDECRFHGAMFRRCSRK